MWEADKNHEASHKHDGIICRCTIGNSDERQKCQNNAMEDSKHRGGVW